MKKGGEFYHKLQGKIAKQAEAEINTFKSLVEMYGVKFPTKSLIE